MLQKEKLQKIPAIALVGPTAIGKTSLSIDLAKEFNCEIIGVDSMQVYKYMDIGTAKITHEEMAGIPHHLIDVAFPDEEYDAARFVREASAAIETIAEKGKIPLLTGGTGLYLKALTQGLFAGVPEDEKIRAELNERLVKDGSSKLHEELTSCDEISAHRIHPNDTNRVIRGLEIYIASGIPWSEHIRIQSEQQQGSILENILQIGLTCDRKRLYERINLRTEIMLDSGLEKEVRSLLEMGYNENLNSMGSIGYRHMLNYIYDKWTFAEMQELLARDTRRYAKRQYTWFKKIDGLEWNQVTETAKIKCRIESWLKSR
ncbi:tRNA (adenosine(37)-N6)-dimethylallyltransferase MiaA [Desulfosediminicola flagellatus]|uniref:tRNA (adenosine(37)-N6)-dimethylallyltransferase MiaA n=1 Tax=Desulfosediminicola flagellatus TaxID=2569541 RepID=UPI0010AC4014|nr:tRNA (adenosine(37)-N6)-dimethylallyltransferase MiaA [Desulfosediminicola flagellatus]